MKRIFKTGMVIITITGLLLAGCVSLDPSNPKKVDRNLGVYNPDNLPANQLCTLEIVGGIHVRQFNGVTVGDSPFFGETALAGWGVGGYNANMKGSTVVAVIQIPAGSHTLLTSFYVGNGEKHAIVRDVRVSHNFAAGHTYRLNATLNAGAASIEMWTLNSIPYNILDSISFRIEEMDGTNP